MSVALRQLVAVSMCRGFGGLFYNMISRMIEKGRRGVARMQKTKNWDMILWDGYDVDGGIKNEWNFAGAEEFLTALIKKNIEYYDYEMTHVVLIFTRYFLGSTLDFYGREAEVTALLGSIKDVVFEDDNNNNSTTEVFLEAFKNLWEYTSSEDLFWDNFRKFGDVLWDLADGTKSINLAYASICYNEFEDSGGDPLPYEFNQSDGRNSDFISHTRDNQSGDLISKTGNLNRKSDEMRMMRAKMWSVFYRKLEENNTDYTPAEFIREGETTRGSSP